MLRAVLPLAALACAVVTGLLGAWQLERARQKEDLEASVRSKALLPPLPAGDLSDERQVHRVALVQGRWKPDTLVFLENRTMAGRAGFIVLTALELQDGPSVLVQRGWQPRDIRDRTLTQAVPTPVDREVQLRARVAPAPSRLMDFEGGAPGTIRQNVDLQLYAAEFGLPALLPVSLQQLEAARICNGLQCEEQVDDGLLREWAVVGSSAARNRGYAVQWFSLSALVVGLFVWFQWLRPWSRRPNATVAPH